MSYTVKNVQTWNTMDGGGYNCKLYRDNKQVAYCEDTGHGGMVMVQFTEKAESILFYDFLKTLPKWSLGEEYGEHDMTADIFIGDLISKYEELRWFKRHCSKNTLFRLIGDKSDSWRTIARPYDAAVKKYITDKYGDQLQEIANERLIEKPAAPIVAPAAPTASTAPTAPTAKSATSKKEQLREYLLAHGEEGVPYGVVIAELNISRKMLSDYICYLKNPKYAGSKGTINISVEGNYLYASEKKK